MLVLRTNSLIIDFFKGEKYCLPLAIFYLLQRHANAIDNYTRYSFASVDTWSIFNAILTLQQVTLEWSLWIQICLIFSSVSASSLSVHLQSYSTLTHNSVTLEGILLKSHLRVRVSNLLDNRQLFFYKKMKEACPINWCTIV